MLLDGFYEVIRIQIDYCSNRSIVYPSLHTNDRSTIRCNVTNVMPCQGRQNGWSNEINLANQLRCNLEYAILSIP